MPAPQTEFARDGTLSESAAWREIARRIAHGAPMEFGLCDLADRLGNRIDLNTLLAMIGRASAYASQSPDRWRSGFVSDWFAYPPGTHREERILAALWLALESEDDDG